MLYATKHDDKTMARAQGVSLPVSLKQSAEVCRFIRNKKYSVAVKQLESVLQMKTAVPYRRFNRGGTGHRPGIGPGRYPVKATTHILKLLKSAYSNAKSKGLDTKNLIINGAVAKQGPKVMHAGRKRGRQAKRAHIEIVVMQTQGKKASRKTAENKEKK